MSGSDSRYASEYRDSVEGAVWPKAAVAAGAFWRFNASIAEEAIDRRLDALNARMEMRGSKPCQCTGFGDRGAGCTMAARCGVAYTNYNHSQQPVDLCG
jgi:hypothetical protein